ncbi:hypothetical protein [Saezia sanguinis]|uniref:hypothetical protein n=1 Tax=Saezia sanguinis TaxID=1965230 RepID=UPI00304986A2
MKHCYVPIENYKGEILNEEALKYVGKKPKAPKPERKQQHRGWDVLGLPPDHNPKHPKSIKARVKPFATSQAAFDCKAYIEKMGWTQVRVIELIR